MRAVSLSALPPHFARVGASRLVRFGVGLAAAAIAASVAVSACARTRPPRYPELLSLADALDREPARTLGRAALLLATLALACAGLARKLELDLRRAQVPRKEAPVGEFPAPHDDALLPERVATLAHAAASLAAPCALVTSDRAAFFALSLVTRLFAELSACLHAHVDGVLGNTCDADATRARAALALSAVACELASAIARAVAAASHHANDERNDDDEKEHRLANDPAAFAAAALELACVFSLLLYALTWARSFRASACVLGAVDRPAEEEDDLEASEDEALAYGYGPFGYPSERGLGGRHDSLSFSSFGSDLGGADHPGERGGGGGGGGGGRGPGGVGRPSPLSPRRAPPPPSPPRVHHPPPPFTHRDGRVVNGLRPSPATPGVPRVDSSDRIYRQLHEPFMRRMEEEGRIE